MEGARRRAWGGRAYGPARPTTAAFLTAALTEAELQDLTLRLYDAAPLAYVATRGLYDWERSWYERDLPPAPARVLVTAAGSGREVEALLERGYSVDAFEPVPRFAKACAGLAGFGTVVQASHDDFVRAVLGDGGGPAAPLRERKYDAVIVGWGSLSHVLDPEARGELLRACARAAPRGPVLVSFTARWEAPADRSAVRAARAAGERLCRLRGATPAPAEVGMLWHAGFRHATSRREVEELAALLGRRVLAAPVPYGRATFLPPP